MTAFWSQNRRLKVLQLALAGVVTLCFLFCAAPGGSVAAASELRFLTVEEPPTNYLENGEVVGTSVDLVRELARLLDETIDIELLPPARAILIANTTANRVLFTAALTEARKAQGYHAIGPVITRKHVLYARKGRNLQLAKLGDLITQNLTVSGTDGDWRSAYLKERGVVVETTTEHLLNLKKLMVNRTDLWISSDIEAPPILAEAGVDRSEIEEVLVIRTAPSYILVSNGTAPEVLRRWRAAFRAMSSDQDFLDKVTSKWSRKLGMDFGYDRGTGFFVKSGGDSASRS